MGGPHGGRELSGPAVGAGAQGVVFDYLSSTKGLHTITRVALTLVGCGGLDSSGDIQLPNYQGGTGHSEAPEAWAEHETQRC